MSISAVKIETPSAELIKITDLALSIDLSDGRTIAVPISWYPRLANATEEERNNFEIFGNGQYIHWDDVDEDITVENLLLGKPSMESQSSLKKWLEARNEGR